MAEGPHPQPSSAERRLELFVNSIRDYAVFMLDANGRVASWNTGARLLKGYAPSEIIGESITRFYTPEDRAEHRSERLLAEARELGRVEDVGWRVRKDGTLFWADVVISAMRDENGTLLGYVKVTRDLTDRRRADEERFQQEERFRLLVQSARDYAIFMLDPKGRVATWNEGAQRIKGYTANEIIGQHFSKFYPADVPPGTFDWELESALQKGRFEDEGWRLRKDGTRFWANVVITPLHDSDGKHIGFSKITRDLTERRMAEIQSLDLARAQESLRLRDEFLSIASHELRTPLMALQLQIDSLRTYAKLEPKQATKLERAGRNVTRLVDLVNSLLDVSRISRGKLGLAVQRIDLGALIAETIDRLHESAQAARCRVTSTLASGVEGVWDPLRMGQLVSNLLSNAFKYAAGTDVTVTLERDGDTAVVRVEDRGPGIPEGEHERVFGRFARAASARNYAGMGLGLFVSREIASAHGGTISAAARDGGGAAFELRLPIRENPPTPGKDES